jgi:hypothetical protein
MAFTMLISPVEALTSSSIASGDSVMPIFDDFLEISAHVSSGDRST